MDINGKHEPDEWAYTVGSRIYEHMRHTTVLAPVFEVFDWNELDENTQRVFAEAAVLAQ